MDKVEPVEQLPTHAYKACAEHEGTLFTGPFSQTPIIRGVWMKALWEPTDKTPLSYKAGFHVFKHEVDAKQYSEVTDYPRIVTRQVIRVEIRGTANEGTTTYGMCADLPSYSVDEIRFPEAS